MPLDASSRPLLGQLALWMALLVVVVAPLALGAVNVEVVAALAAVAHLALALHVVDRWRSERTLRVSWLGLPLLLGLGFTWLELMPLPRFLRALLSPEGVRRVEHLSAALAPEYQALVRPVLSLDPPESAFAVLRLATALSVFVVVADRCKRREHRRLAYRVVLGGAFALVVAAFAHKLLRLEGIWGVFDIHVTEGSQRAYVPPLPPLVSPNHFARAAGGLGLLCLARGLYVRSRVEMAWFLVVGTLALSSLLFSRSYGAALAVVVAGLFLALRRRSGDAGGEAGAAAARRSPFSLVAALAVLTAVVAVATIGMSALGGDPEGVDAPLFSRSKLAVYQPALSLLVDFWRAGVGNGGFQAGFPYLLEPGALWGDATISHVENIAIQTLVDHGALLGGALFVVAAAVARHIGVRWWRGAEVPALGALVFLVVGDLFDFSLEVGFGLFLVAAVLALVAAELDASFRALPRRAALALVLALAVTSAAAASVALRDQRIIVDKRIRAAADDEQRVDQLLRAAARHPSDAHYAYSLAASARKERKMKAALVWSSRALYLRPSHPGAHREAARTLLALGHRDQALLEYSLAHKSGGAGVLAEVVRRFDELDEMLRAVPEGDLDALAHVCALLAKQQRLDDAQRCADRGLEDERAPESLVGAAVRYAMQRQDLAGAQRRLDEAARVHPLDGELAALAVTLVHEEQGLDEAVAFAARALPSMRERAPLYRWQLKTLVEAKRFEEARAALTALLALSPTARQLAEIDRYAAVVHEALHNDKEALVVYRRISTRQPKNADVWVRIGEVSARLGLLSEAERAARRALALRPNHAGAEALLGRLVDDDAATRQQRLRRLRGQAGDGETRP